MKSKFLLFFVVTTTMMAVLVFLLPRMVSSTYDFWEISGVLILMTIIFSVLYFAFYNFKKMKQKDK